MKGRTRVHLAASRVHKWLALVIGAQLLIWFASGVIMSFLPIDKVRGEHLVDRKAIATIPPDTPMVAPATLIAQAGAPVEAVAWRMLDGEAIARLRPERAFACSMPALVLHCRPSMPFKRRGLHALRGRGQTSHPHGQAELPPKALNIGVRCPHGASPLPTQTAPASLSRQRAEGSLPFGPELGGSMIFSGAFTSWTGRITRISTPGGCWLSPLAA